MNEKNPTLCIVAGPNGSGKTSTTVPVSYTHLDVYKRQPSDNGSGKESVTYQVTDSLIHKDWNSSS